MIIFILIHFLSKKDEGYEEYLRYKERTFGYEEKIYLKYEQTLVDTTIRGGFELYKRLDNLIYKDEIDKNKLYEKIKPSYSTAESFLINNELHCKLDNRNWNSIAKCMDLYRKITELHLKNLKTIELKDNVKKIDYSYENQQLWRITLSSDNYYELSLSKKLREKIGSWYSVILPEKIYGKLTNEEKERITKLSLKNYNEKTEEEVKFLKEIIPFIEFLL